MTARIGAWIGPAGEERNTNQASDAMSYDLAVYHLKTVFDTERSEYRNIATDRVTQISIGGETLRSASAE
jgi:predicted component of type VI protein secretion system